MKILGGHFDLDSKQDKIERLESELNDKDIWNDVDHANKLTTELSYLKKEVLEFKELSDDINSNLELLRMLKDDNDDELLQSVVDEYEKIKVRVKDLEVKVLLSGEFDNSNCFLEIHPGAGGTESCDWAAMLLRMYTMFFDKFGLNYNVIEKQNGDEAGIKSVMVEVKGPYAYGYLKSEIGVHRLVRISPFDANARRHTSFAAVNVIPDVEKVAEIEIKDEDIRVDVYRSSGNGGQGVNTTDSAVRITHLATGIVVAVQNERSQIKNKEIALRILKNKLYQIEVEKREKEIASLKSNVNIDFGSQIRNYVLEPYSLVKDLRSGYETSNPEKVLDGDLYPFIEAYLRVKR